MQPFTDVFSHLSAVTARVACQARLIGRLLGAFTDSKRAAKPALLLCAGLACSTSMSHPGNVDEKGCHTEKRTGNYHCHNPHRPLPQFPKAGDEGVFSGKLTWVHDGDGLFVVINGAEMELRLADIDAPERDQPYGWEAKLELIDLVRGKELTVMLRDVDRYGRNIANVWADGLYVNRTLVERGAAWFYPEYAEDPSLFEVENQTRRDRRGLWALSLSERVEPWEWRKRRKAESRARN